MNMNKIWKLLIIANVIASTALSYACLNLYEDRNNLRVELFLEIAKQDLLLKNQDNIITDLQKRIDEMNRRLAMYELSNNGKYDSNGYISPEKDITINYKESENNIIEDRERNYGFSIDVGDCSGAGDGIVGLFVDVYTKCPGNMYGYLIRVD